MNKNACFITLWTQDVAITDILVYSKSAARLEKIKIPFPWDFYLPKSFFTQISLLLHNSLIGIL